ncbi:hypothetical protein GWI33_011689, partial [Rhynchophorus ferrugineus]
MEDAEPGNMYNLEKEKVEQYHPKQEEEEKEQLVRIMTRVTNGEWSKQEEDEEEIQEGELDWVIMNLKNN